MSVSHYAQFPTALDSLAPLADWLKERLSALAVDDEWRFALDLAVCEVATNIIRHALHEDASHLFSVQFDIRNSDVYIVFTDAGDAFPMEQLEAARQDHFCERSPLLECGRGLMIVIHYVDSFDVRREDNKNITVIKKQVFNI